MFQGEPAPQRVEQSFGDLSVADLHHNRSMALQIQRTLSGAERSRMVDVPLRAFLKEISETLTDHALHFEKERVIEAMTRRIMQMQVLLSHVLSVMKPLVGQYGSLASMWKEATKEPGDTVEDVGRQLVVLQDAVRTLVLPSAAQLTWYSPSKALHGLEKEAAVSDADKAYERLQALLDDLSDALEGLRAGNVGKERVQAIGKSAEEVIQSLLKDLGYMAVKLADSTAAASAKMATLV
jgi:hypothetical protein